MEKAIRRSASLTPRASLLRCDIRRQACKEFRIGTVNGVIEDPVEHDYLPARNMALQICL